MSATQGWAVSADRHFMKAARERAAKVPVVFVLLACTIFLPEETSFYVGTLRMTLARLVLLVAAPYAIYRYGRMFGARNYRFVWDDALIPLFGVWMIIAPTVAESLSRGLAFGGSAALELCLPYMLIRGRIDRHGQALVIVKMILIAISIVGLLGLLDWATNEWFVRDLASKLTGYVKDYGSRATQYDWRFGLLRASSAVEHPIHLGAICAIGAMLSTALRGWLRWSLFLACLIGLMTSLSSAPAGAFALGIGLLTYEAVLRKVPGRRAFLALLSCAAVAVIFAGSSNPWAFIFSKLCFDPTTGDYRLQEWQTLWPYVLQAPIFGSGTGQESLSQDLLASVDSLWLRDAIWLGIPGMILTFLIFPGCASLKINFHDRNLNLGPQEQRLALSLDIVIVMLVLIGTTVYFWGAIWVFMGLSFGLRAHIGNLAALPSQFPRENSHRPNSVAQRPRSRSSQPHSASSLGALGPTLN